MATPITGEIASSPNGQTALEEAIAGLTGGGFVTVYRIGDDIFAQLHDAAGVAVGAAINLRGTLPVTSQMLTPDVAATDDGGFVVTYRASGSVNAVYSQKFTAAGVAVGPENVIPVLTATADQPRIDVLSDGGYVIVYRDSSAADELEIYVQRYDATGVADGSPTFIDVEDAIESEAADVASLADGGYVVVHGQLTTVGGTTHETVVRRFDEAGIQQGADIALPIAQAGIFPGATVTGLQNGGFVVVYNSGPTADITYNLYDAAGTLVTSALANTELGAVQRFASVTDLPNGGFVIVWEGPGAHLGGDGTDLIGRQFDSSGTAVAGEFLINTTTTGNQTFSPATSVTTLSDGDIAVAIKLAGASSELAVRLFEPAAVSTPTITSAEATGVVDEPAADAAAFGAANAIADLAGSTGFRIPGQAAEHRLGNEVAGLGDINGDGFDDFIVGVYGYDEGGLNNIGAAHIVFGTDAGLPYDLDVTAFDGTNGFTVDGLAGSDSIGSAVTGIGDVNSDGFDDILIGARGSDAVFSSGEAFVVYGKASGFAASLTAADMDGIVGTTLGGANFSFFGDAVGRAGDLNGDGIDDLIVGAQTRATGAGSQTGASFVVFGEVGGLGASLNVTTLDGTNGFAIEGVAAGDRAGVSVEGGGDLNGDGIDDILIGADQADSGGYSGNGAVYVVFGDAAGFSATLALSTLNGTNGFVVEGVRDNSNFGDHIAIIGDINNDGFDDFAIGDTEASPNGVTVAGQVHVIFGTDAGFATSFDVATLNGTNGFTVNGVAVGNRIGEDLTRAGDFNGDGIDDLLIGTNEGSLGKSYVLYGTSAGFGSTFDLSNIDGVNGVEFNGEPLGARVGVAVSFIGDFNGDGVDDIIAANRNGIADGNSSSGLAFTAFGVSENGLASGSILFQDGALGDVHTISSNSVSIGNIGTFSAELVDAHDAGGFGEVEWSFIATAAELNPLAAGEVLTQTYEVNIDNGVGIATQTITVTINGANDTPIAVDDAFTTEEDSIVSGDLTADNGAGVDSDIEGDALTVTEINGVAVSDGQVVNLSSGALLTINVDGTFDYDPNGAFDALAAGATSADSFTYTIDDGAGGTDTATANLTINGVNDPPIAADDAFTTDEDTPLTAGDLFVDNGAGADVDPDGAFTVTEINGAAVTNGQVVALASGALLTIRTDGTFDYDPNGAFETLAAGASAADSFTYAIDDGGLDQTLTASGSLTVFNVGAFFVVDFDTNQTSVIARTNGDLLPAVLPTDGVVVLINPNNSNVAVSATSFAGGVQTARDGSEFSLTNFSGSATFGVASASFSGSISSGTLIWEGNVETPTGLRDVSFTFAGINKPGGFPGDITLSATDVAISSASTALVNLTINGVNDPPVAQDDAFATDEDTALIGGDLFADNGSGVDSDADSAFTITEINGVAVSDGQVVTLSSGALLTIRANGTFDYDPNGAFEDAGAGGETDNFTYTIDDGAGGTDTATANFAIQAVNDPSVITAPQPGLAAQFDGNSSNAISVAHDPALSATSWTVEAWITTTDADSEFNRILAKLVSGNQTYSLVVRDGEAHVRFGAPGDNFVQGGFVADGEAHHIAGVFDASVGTLFLYVDGALIGQLTTANVPPQGTEPLDIGRAGAAFPQGFNGEISEVRVWSDARSAAEIEANFNQALSPVEANLELYLTFDGDAVDQSGNGRDGTIVGTVPFVAGVAPVDEPFIVAEDAPATLDGIIISDVDAGAGDLRLTVTVVNGFLNFANLSGATQTSAPGPATSITLEGTLAELNAALATLTYTGNTNFNGQETLTITVDDLGNTGGPAENATEIVSFEVVSVNDPPVAADDAFATDEDTALINGDLFVDNSAGVDADPDTAFVIAEINAAPIIDGQTIMLASGALLTIRTDGTFDYDPNGAFESLAAGASSSDSFTYTIDDGAGGTDTATANLTINGVNDPPVAQDDAVSTDEDTILTGGDLFADNGFGPDADADGDGLAVTEINGVAVSDGEVVTLASGAQLTINADGTFSYDPFGQFETLAAGQSATDSFTYAVSDGQAGGGPGVFDASFDLATLDGTDGFVINGAAALDTVFDVNNAGDINNDGVDDIAVSTRQPNGQAGKGYIVFGSDSGFAPSFELSSLNGTNGFSFDGPTTADLLGESISGLGDVNGDGIDDFIVGAKLGDPFGDGNGLGNAGEAFVVFGTGAGFAATLDLTTLNGANGFVINGIGGQDRLGYSVSGAGDFNGDGFNDIIVGAYAAYGVGGARTGQAYIVFGSDQGFNASFDASSIDGSNGVALSGFTANNTVGEAVSGIGDFNGDGIDDVVVGTHFGSPGGLTAAGYAFVVFGSTTPFGAEIDLSTLNGSNGFRIDGLEVNDFLGREVSGAGDINGDGIEDLIVSVELGDPGGRSNAGEAYVIFGSATPFGAVFDPSTLDGSNGFIIAGADANDQFSRDAIRSAGDLNADGVDDLVLGAFGGDPNGIAAGEAYVLFGSTAGFNSVVELLTLDGTNGFLVPGLAAGDQTGRTVGGGGDFNGDGIADVLIGSREADPNGVDRAGTVHVIFGRAGLTADTADVTVTINGVNDAPVALDDAFITDEDTAILALDLFADNGFGADSDPDSAFTLSQINGAAVSDGQVIILPSGAELKVGTNGVVDYNPNSAFETLAPGASGADSFTYTIDDGAGGVATATANVTINGLADAPTLQVLSVSAGETPEILGAEITVFDAAVASEPSVAALTGGGFVTTYRSGSDLFAQLLNADGSPNGAAILVEDFGGSATIIPTVNSVTAVSDGGFAIAYAGQNPANSFFNTGIYSQRFDASGAKVGAEQVTAINGSFSAVSGIDALANGGHIVSYRDTDTGVGRFDSFIQRYDATGAKDGAPINVGSVEPIAGNNPSVAGLGNGGYVVAATEDNVNVVLYIRDAANAVVAGPIIANTGTPAFNAAITELDGGGFVVVYTVNGDPAFRIFNDDGTPRSVELPGTPVNPGADASVDVAPLDDGGFVIATISTDSSAVGDTNGFGVTGQRYDASGATVGDPFLINTTTAGSEQGRLENTLAVSPNGDLFAVYVTNNNQGDILGQIFSTGGGPLAADEDTDLPLPLDAMVVDVGAALEIAISNFPAGGVFNLGAADGANWLITGAEALDLSTLIFTPPANFNGEFTFTIEATSTANGQSASTTVTQDAAIAPVADAPVVTVGAAGGAELTSPIDTTALTGEDGFVITADASVGLAAGHGRGGVSFGDLNNDGFADVAIGARTTAVNGVVSAGQVHVVFGGPDFDPTLAVTALDGTNGFSIDGLATNDFLGDMVNANFDFNGDGIDDLLTFASGSDLYGNNKGAYYVIYGGQDFSSGFDLTTIDGTNGFIVHGVTRGDRGQDIATDGDVNGDGIDDLVFLDMYDFTNSDGGPSSLHGTAYVLFGGTDPTPTNIDISTSADVVIKNVRAAGGGGIGYVEFAGDVNNDGFDDIVIGSQGSPGGPLDGAGIGTIGNVGDAALIFGGASLGGPIDIQTLDGTNGFRLIPNPDDVAFNSGVGGGVGGVGDINDDGFDDFAVAVRVAGGVGVIFGAGSFDPVFDLTDFDGTNGVLINGAQTRPLSIADAGDVNSDGVDDLIIGAFGAPGTVVLGDPNLPASINLTDDNVIVLTGGTFEANIAGNDDVNGDGVADFAASNANPGQVFVVFGAGPTPQEDEPFALPLDVEAPDMGAVVDIVISGFPTGLTFNLGAPDGANWLIAGAEALDLSTLIFAPPSNFSGDFTLNFEVTSTAGPEVATTTVTRDVSVEPVVDAPIVSINVGGGALPAVIDPATFDGTNGLLIVDDPNDGFGTSLGRDAASLGDVNGDGFADIVVGSRLSAPNGQNLAGQLHVIFGGPNLDASIDTDTLDGTNGFTIDGLAAIDLLGEVVAADGDLNGDGINDIVVHAAGSDLGGANRGAYFVIYGGQNFGASFDLTSLDGTNGFTITGLTRGDRGQDMNIVGDVNGDGIDDLAIGDSYAGADPGFGGKAYLIYGSTAPRAASLSVTTDADVTLKNIRTEFSGGAAFVNAAGDVNGDGFDDIVFSNPYSTLGGYYGAGTAGVLFGDSALAADIDVQTLDGTDGFQLQPGIVNQDFTRTFGFGVGAVGDLNDDGFDDVGFARLTESDIVVLFGGTTFDAVIDPKTLGPEDLIEIEGGVSAVSRSRFGPAGDVNGDGVDDAIIGLVGGGVASIVLGSPDIQPVISVGDANVIPFVPGQSNPSVAGAADVNGDGASDFLATHQTLGQGYLVFGVTATPEEDTSFALPLSVELADADGSEAITAISLAGLLAGFEISDGVNTVTSDGVNDIDLIGFDLSATVITPAAEFNGLVTLTLTATSTETATGEAATATDVVTLDFVAVNDAPMAADDALATDEDTPVSADIFAANGGVADADIDGDVFTLSRINGLDVFDGEVVTLASGALLTTRLDGTVDYDPNGVFEALAVGETAADSFAYTIDDGAGGTDTAIVDLIINGVNDDPVAADDEFTVQEDFAQFGLDLFSDNGFGVDIDPDTAFNLTEINGVLVGNGQVITLPSGAVLTVRQDGTFDFDPSGAFEALSEGALGADSFTYTIDDGAGGVSTATANFTIQGANDAPIAADDILSGDEDTPFSGDLFASNGGEVDSDIDDFDLQLFQINGVDVFDGETVTLASGALLTIRQDGTFDYDPNGAFDTAAEGGGASESFTYTIRDSSFAEGFATAFVEIAGINDAPIARDDLFETTEDALINGGLLADNGFGVDFDLEGDALVISQVGGTTVGAGPSTSVTLASGAVVTAASDGSFTYNPGGAFDALAEGAVAEDSFTYTLNDPNGGVAEAVATFLVTGVNDAPIAAADAFTIDENAILAGALLADNGAGEDVDAENDPLTVTAINGVALVPGQTVILTSGARLTVETDGTFTYDQGDVFDALSSIEAGADSFIYTISDGDSEATATASIEILGANDAPRAVADTFTIAEDGELNGDLTVDNGSGPDIDIDADTLSIVAINGQALSPGGDVTLSSGARLTVGEGGLFSYEQNDVFESLAAGETAIDGFTYTLSDGTITNDATVSLTITGANDAPTALPDAFTTDEDTAITGLFLLEDNGQGADFDVDGDVLSLIAIDGLEVQAGDSVTLVSGAVIAVSENGEISYDPNAAFEALEDGETTLDTFTYQISDGFGATAEAEAQFEITGRTDIIFGTADADILEGGGDDDEIQGLAGDDLISGFSGNDLIDAGGGADRARGGLGDDSAFGGAGDDTLFGEGGADTLRGGDGDDRLRGQRGEDMLFGEAGNDVLAGAKDADTLRGGIGDDTLVGGGADDRLFGQAGVDKLNGGRGADHLVGGRGGDRLNGGGGEDTLIGGAGDDTLIGGGGADTFRFDGNDGADVLRGFQQGLDQIEIVSGALGFGDLALSQVGVNTEISFGSTSILAIGQGVEAFGEDDFIF